ncbi:MAG TPA: FAD-binding oxidoreductase [Acidimicrobiales bacterium]|nr:FAD-binding oxidoreductase [Acidimicrobiales bacterium]
MNASVWTGWGGTPRSVGHAAPFASTADANAVLAAAGPRGVIGRGLGRSYGDAAQNAGGAVAECATADAIANWNPKSGAVTLGAGVTIDQLMRWALPRGYFVPVIPGTRHITVGGAIAADIHGKNHHQDGTFGRHVESMVLCAPTATHRLTPSMPLFGATTGGMGLTGLIAEATVRLHPVETAYVTVDTERAPNLDALLASMTDHDEQYRYSVAWVDLLASGRSLGRGVLTSGDHATRDALPPRLQRRPLHFAPAVRAGVPALPVCVLVPPVIAAFNEFWYRKAPARRHGEVQSITEFFHPLDQLAGWNHLYGRRGFLQYQFVVPHNETACLEKIVTQLADTGAPSFLAVLKRFGPQNDAPLSFPIAGWTLTVDVPAHPELAPVLRRLDHLVAGAGGRVYLAKDSRLDPSVLATMYPRLAEWRALRNEADPAAIMTSDLDRRLNLSGRHGALHMNAVS